MAVEKICARCGRKLVCRSEDVANCACSRFTLSPEQQRAIAGIWKECLCPSCLDELQHVDAEKIHD